MGSVEQWACGDDAIDVYIVEPPSPTGKAIVLIYDVFGFSGGRVKGVCDQLASAGFTVVMPDVYNGTNILEEGGLGNADAMAWLKAVTVWEDLGAKFNAVIGELRSRGASSVGAFGFCWGAYPVLKLSAEGVIAAGASAHPSLKLGKMFFDETEEDQCKAAHSPILFLPAGNDPEMYMDGSLTELIEAQGFEAKSVAFPDMRHGFVLRGDAGDSAVARDVTASLAIAVEFFSSHLK